MFYIYIILSSNLKSSCPFNKNVYINPSFPYISIFRGFCLECEISATGFILYIKMNDLYIDYNEESYED